MVCGVCVRSRVVMLEDWRVAAAVASGGGSEGKKTQPALIKPMKRRINEDFLPPAPVPMAAIRPATSGRLLRSAKPESKPIAVVTTSKPTQRAAPTVGAPPPKSLLGFKTKSITHHPRRRLEDSEELDEEAAPLLLDEEDAVPIGGGENLAPNDNVPLVDREAALCRQIELLNLETIPALELKLQQSEASRLEDVRKLVFAVKSERAQHAQQLEALQQQQPEPSLLLLVASLRTELAETRQQPPACTCAAATATLEASNHALQQQLSQCKEQALRDFVEAQSLAAQAAQRADQLAVLLERANQDLVTAKLEIGRLTTELDTERTNVQLQREYMIQM